MDFERINVRKDNLDQPAEFHGTLSEVRDDVAVHEKSLVPR